MMSSARKQQKINSVKIRKDPSSKKSSRDSTASTDIHTLAAQPKERSIQQSLPSQIKPKKLFFSGFKSKTFHPLNSIFKARQNQ